MKAILRKLTNLNIVGADVVEVSPPYDDSGESTAYAAADLAYELFGLMVGNPLYEVEGYIPRKVHSGGLVKKKNTKYRSKDEL